MYILCCHSTYDAAEQAEASYLPPGASKGTRINVTIILDSLAEGARRGEFIHSYPSLQPHHIDAALAYAAELACEESLLRVRAG